jgi:hypothetical protein
MPEGIEYLHCVQMALDKQGLRYQVLDVEGRVRERLAWPIDHPIPWRELPPGAMRAPFSFPSDADHILALRLRGETADGARGMQTLLCARLTGGLSPLWIGLRGREQRLTAIVHSEPGRSPHYWIGPKIGASAPFDIHLVLHPAMGPGGIIYKLGAEVGWTSMAAASAWGLERLLPWETWIIGHEQRGGDDRPFAGTGLVALAALAQA